MSSQRGNTAKKRPQKHQNKTSFKNDLHDKTPRTKLLNSLDITDVCDRCKGVLEWRIKFKKYKLSKNPRTCVKCSRRNVTMSYRVMCGECASRLAVCPKCGLNKTEQEAEAAKQGADDPDVLKEASEEDSD